jgi:hypothetical protein
MRMIKTTPKIPAFFLSLSLSLGTVLLATGCDTSDGAGPAGTGPHGTGIANCDALLTREEAAVILGGAIESVTARDSLKIMNCTYKAVSIGDLLPPEIRITAFTTDGYAADFHTTVPAYYDALDVRTAVAIKTPVAGIGTKAMYMLNPRKLAMYKSDVYADIICRPHGLPAIDTSTAAFEGAKAVGVKVAAKL